MANPLANLINTIGSVKNEIDQNKRNPSTSNQALDSSAGDTSNYTNKIFGAPFQLLDSVDKRFDDVNPNLGLEYLKNFILNSPILYIQPGIPHYTGGEDGESIINNMYKDSSSGQMSSMGSALLSVAQKNVFDGSNLQKRMFGIKQDYYNYMKYVNYMCRSTAMYMGLIDGNSEFPNFTFTTGNVKSLPFETMKWENYRMMANDYVPTPIETVKMYLKSNTVGAFIGNLSGIMGDYVNSLMNDPSTIDNQVKSSWDQMKDDANKTMFDIYSEIPKTVQFMVEPVAFEESVSNTVEPSFIESAIDSITTGIGSEIGFIMNSNVDSGILDELAGIVGGTTESAAMALEGLVSPATGGFMGSLFKGAVNSVKGQKMIYPDIYKSSTSTMDYQFSITLTTPYGDMYNYYMNIVVPLLHLIALVAPRMHSANSLMSPFLVKAYMPGMCTCEMGIIQNMSISKNPTGKHVSINGYPLTVKVTFTIKELYNALSISPGDDPVAFLFNETLNDYLCNLAGMVPSMETHAKVRANMLNQISNYFDEFMENNVATGVRNSMEGFFKFN